MVFNFTINCHLEIKYFDQENKHVDESTLETRYLVPLIPHIYDHTFTLKSCKFLYVSVAALDKF